MSGGNSLANKIVVLQKIKADKDILFGAFSSTLTKQDKTKKWTEVKDLAQSLGIRVGKDWCYIRDTIWGNWQERTIEKKDNASRTGTGGGSSAKFTEMDHLVLDILGKGNPVVVGLGQTDSLGVVPVPREPPTSKDESLSRQGSDIVEASNDIRTFHEFSASTTSTNTGTASKRGPPPNSRQMKQDLEEAIKTKLELENEYLELKNYKLRLEILQLERNLQIPRSPFTENLPSYNNYEDAGPSYTYL